MPCRVGSCPGQGLSNCCFGRGNWYAYPFISLVAHSAECRIPRLASVDYVTERAIQPTLHDSFATRTVLCIAHRLRTILAYDRICVCDDGRVAELDTPLNLFAKTDGLFRGMCNRSGIDEKAIRDAQLDGYREWIE